MKTQTIDTKSGTEAIEYAEKNGLTLSKYADPTEDAREGLSPEEARDIAAEDPSLIYIAPADLIRVEAPWAAKWTEVAGGIRCWESISEYNTWMAQV